MRVEGWRLPPHKHARTTEMWLGIKTAIIGNLGRSAHQVSVMFARKSATPEAIRSKSKTPPSPSIDVANAEQQQQVGAGTSILRAPESVAEVKLENEHGNASGAGSVTGVSALLNIHEAESSGSCNILKDESAGATPMPVVPQAGDASASPDSTVSRYRGVCKPRGNRKGKSISQRAQARGGNLPPPSNNCGGV